MDRTHEIFDWPVTARDAELHTIKAALGRRGGALLVGAPGVGKSLLLSTALRLAAREGRRVLHVGGVGWNGATGTQGFGTLAECLEEAVRPSSGTVGAAGAAGDRALIGIDDAHLVDAASGVRLHRLVAAGRISVLATTRQDVPAPAGVDKLWVERLVEHIEVAPFDSAAMGRVLRARLGGHTDTATLERLWAATHGNALMLRELVEHALEDGSLAFTDGAWRWPGLGARPGKRLADVVGVGLRDLGPEEHELVNMLAVAEPLEDEIVAAAGLGRAAEALDLRGIVSVERRGARARLRLAVPLARLVVAHRMSGLTAQRLRREVADALERTGARRDDDVLRIVSLRMDAGLVPEREQILAAARIATRRRDFPLAERMCLLALQETAGEPDVPPLCGPVPDTPEYRAELHRLMTRVEKFPEQTADRIRAALLLGRVLVGRNRPAEAETVLSAALGTEVRVPLEEYVAAVHTRVTNMAWGLSRLQDARDLLARTIARMDPDHAGVLRGTQAAIAVMADDLRGVVAIGDGVLDEPAVDRPVAQALVPVVAYARSELGDPTGALGLLDRYQDSTADWDTDAVLLVNAVRARCSALLGRLESAAEALETVHRYDPGHGRPALLQAVLDRSRLLRLLGRPDEAVALLRRTVASDTSHEYPVTAAWPLAQLAGALAESGDHTEALRTLVEVRSLRGTTPASPIAEDEIAYENALVLAHTGDHYGAGVQAAELAGRAAAAGRTVRAVAGLLLAARVTDGAAVRFPHRALLRDGRNAGGLVRVLADYVEALADADGALLMEVSEQLVRMGALPLATEAAAQAARAFKASGQHRKGREAAAACRDLLRDSGAPLPSWVGRDGRQEPDSVSLTPREREVAALAATGMSNRDIADRLVVSVRTVENHLHRIYHKLGITARNDLKRGLEKLTGRPQEPGRAAPLRLVGAPGGSEQVA
ncbi:LuxR family transcriptional regulator [Streptomyces ruber]|uniref:LuxR family transcriptional regulator n=2 Tax=Streptomyces TaxID=1883 RepID=A0A918BET3_9ACTN|nr:LuxR family transcriptional regulator [Streptomyces ruber]GGQ60735.1 LuxR family transcriptional regulator [Streptomyces ruber]